MNKKELEEMVNADLKIDQTRIQGVAAEQPVLHYKYIRLYGESKLELKKLENKVRQVRSDRFQYYIGKHPEEVSPVIYEKSELKTILDGDKKVLAAEAAMFVKKEMVDTLAMVCDVFKSRQFSIKAIIDIRRLEAGL